ncbi:MAG: exo-alpha-sialidase [Planctomycetaceae bacterium]|jgi:sialidase-1|nr:exo-alpha-sialidase [Planctomycetaceae bacterium]MBT4887407.1 exo-alpha-sialidase [Planctomycetaceae bacterium]MBT6459346.1 exo-alpha-sialidase [Planctomycetaceae bacterium]MBT6919077.1 exo-alpha-sialidase [Planctomycetaceae bacterium]MBT7728853.1 exo-alpha-sialidase [Planctomycetaceae bacterium]
MTALLRNAKEPLLVFAKGRVGGSFGHGDLDVVLKYSQDNGKKWPRIHAVQDDGRHAVAIPFSQVGGVTGQIFLLSCESQHTEGDVDFREK